MNLKNLYVCAGILLVLAILINLFTGSSNAPLLDERVGSSIVDPSALRDAGKIIVESGGDTITLVSSPEANSWVLEEKYSLPTSYTRVSQFARNVSEAKLQRLVSENPERIETLGFEGGDSARFYDTSGNEIVAFDLGKETENGRQFLRYQGEEKAFLVNTTFLIDANHDSWLEKSLVDFEASDVTSIVVSLQNGDTLSIERDNADADWSTSDTLPDDKILNQSALSQIASKFAGLNFTATAEVDDANVVAARDNSHSFDLSLNDGKRYTFTIGRQPELVIEKEVEKEGEDGETTTETEEEVVTPEGPVYFFIASSDPEERINEYMGKAGFEASSYQFTSLPDSLDALLSDAPEPIEEPPAPLVTAPENPEAE